jgi:hypothetical protein
MTGNPCPFLCVFICLIFQITYEILLKCGMPELCLPKLSDEYNYSVHCSIVIPILQKSEPHHCDFLKSSSQYVKQGKDVE